MGLLPPSARTLARVAGDSCPQAQRGGEPGALPGHSHGELAADGRLSKVDGGAATRRQANMRSSGCHAVSVAGGMSRRTGLTLAERGLLASAPSSSAAPNAASVAGGDQQGRSRPVVARHCWVTGLPDRPGRWAGLLAE
jgi:hypothetical protein